jgi:drug/metabolite transporter (DMT)-like permease
MLSPAIIVFTSYLFLGETLPIIGLFGVLCISVGAMILTYSKHGPKSKNSIVNIIRNKSTRMMLLVVGIWSVTTVLDKLVTNELPIAVYVWLLHIGILLGLLVHLKPSVKQLRSLIKSKGLTIFGIGITATIGLILQIYAIQGTYVSYAIAVKNVGILFTVILGFFVLKEKHFKRRFLGAFIMLIGLLLVLLKF